MPGISYLPIFQSEACHAPSELYVHGWNFSAVGFTPGVFDCFIGEDFIIILLDFSLWDWSDTPKKNLSIPLGGHKPDHQCSGSKWGHGPGNLSIHYADVC